MQIQFKRSESLQDYLDTLNKQTHNEENSDDWGFFVDVEIDTHKEKLKIRQYKHKEIITHHHYYHHHHYHNQYQNKNQNDENEYKNNNNNEGELVNYANMFVVAGFLAYLILF